MQQINIGYKSTNNQNVVITTPTTTLPNEVLVTERGVLKITNTNFENILLNTGEAPSISSNLEKVEIIRNFIDDTFNIKVYRTIGEDAGGWDEFPSLGVNNDASLGGPSSPVSGQLTLSTLPANAYWDVNHSMIKDIKFRDSNIIGIGSDLHKSGFVKPIYKYVISPQFEPVPPNVDLRFNQVLHLAAVKKITIYQDSGYALKLSSTTSSTSENSVVSRNNDQFKVKLEYNHLYIEPTPIDRYHGNEILAKVYIKNDGDLPTSYDYKFDVGEMRSTSLGAEHASTYFQLDENPSEIYRGTNAHYLGSIRSFDSLYYDYQNHCVKVGSTSDSIYGDIVPYNYKGEYTREIKMSFNGVFDKLNVRFKTIIDEAILNPSDGSVQLNVSNNKNQIPNSQIPPKYFDMNDIRIIRQHQPSLRGLEGLLNE